MFLPVVLFGSALLIQQTPPAGQTAMPPAPPAAAPATQPEPTTRLPLNVAATPAEPTQVCRTEAVTGSRFGRRVCRSAVQTAAEAAASREMLRRMQGSRVPDS